VSPKDKNIATHKVIALETVKTVSLGGYDLAQYTDYELEVVPLSHPGIPEFVGSLAESENWAGEHSEEYKYF